MDYYWNDNGELVIKAQLSPQQGAVVAKALEAAQHALEREQQHVSAGTAPVAIDGDNELQYSQLPHSKTRFQNKRANASVLIAETFLATGPQGLKRPIASRWSCILIGPR